jgi:hypothetical protein
MKVIRLSALFALLVTSIAVAGPPKPAESKYLITIGGMFLFDAGEIRYAMDYEIKDPMPEFFVVRVSFENPKKGESPITETALLDIESFEVHIQSPPLDCIPNNKKYKVVVELFENESSNKAFGKHKQKVEFSLPPGGMEQFKIPAC